MTTATAAMTATAAEMTVTTTAAVLTAIVIAKERSILSDHIVFPSSLNYTIGTIHKLGTSLHILGPVPADHILELVLLFNLLIRHDVYSDCSAHMA